METEEADRLTIPGMVCWSTFYGSCVESEIRSDRPNCFGLLVNWMARFGCVEFRRAKKEVEKKKTKANEREEKEKKCGGKNKKENWYLGNHFDQESLAFFKASPTNSLVNQ